MSVYITVSIPNIIMDMLKDTPLCHEEDVSFA